MSSSSAHEVISVRGARTHNLKNLSFELPRDKLIVITGLSGSGKSSIAFNTLYAEGRRRYVESLSAYARQFLGTMDKPDVDHIDGLSPAISIEQKSTSHNPRSTVGTITEIYDYLRLLYARVGDARCPHHGHSLNAQSTSEIVDRALELPEGTRVAILSPLIVDQKGAHEHLFAQIRTKGFTRARVDGDIVTLDTIPNLHKNYKHTIEAVCDRLSISETNRQRLAESFETALTMSEGRAILVSLDPEDGLPELLFSNRHACPACSYSINELEPRMFSFNSPHGACDTCDGLGVKQEISPDLVVHNAELSLSDGAIRGWNKTARWFHFILKSVADHYGFSMDVPYKSLSKKAKEIVLFGSGNEKIHLDWKDDSGFEWKQQRPWEGAIPNLERRFRETNSQGIRDAISQYMSNYPCKACNGTRLGETARNVFIDNRQITEITDGSIADTLAYLKSLELAGKDSVIAEKVLDDIISRLQFLSDVGLNYLTLNRSAGTLSGGEAQRIRLASQIGAGLVGVLYILDEPSIGLHQRDNGRLLATLEHLRDIGNTVLVVEHDEEAIRSADHVLDIGPGAGVHGGNVVVSGTVAAIERHNDSITGQYLSGKKKITVPVERESFDFSRSIKLRGATGNNLKKIDVDIPIGLFTCVTGVSGSGKSTLINQTILPIALQALNRAHTKAVKSYDDIKGLSFLDKVVDIDQSPIGRTPRSNPATYTDMFGIIRDLFSQTPESRMRGYKPGRFSFNKKGGRCEECEGDGLIRVEMHFLPDVYVKCDTCQGKRYNRETLEIRYGEKTIADVLDMTVEEAYHFFEPVPKLKAKLATLMDVGLTYIKLGQSATTLSGGEAQRVKLSKELSKRSTGKTLYILDEPTTGLHFEDIRHLLHVLHRLRDSGNTVIVIEHNLDVIKTADWIIDLGPEGGDGGGEIIAVGSPEEVANVRSSFTGQYLRKPLGLDRVSQAAG